MVYVPFSIKRDARSKGEDKYLPHTLGHEGSGIVEQIGADVKKLNLANMLYLLGLKVR